jgi:hypothetical protein
LSQRALYAAARVSPIKRCLLRPHTDGQANKMLRDAWMAGLVRLPCGNWATHERQQWAVHVGQVFSTLAKCCGTAFGKEGSLPTFAVFANEISVK